MLCSGWRCRSHSPTTSQAKPLKQQPPGHVQMAAQHLPSSTPPRFKLEAKATQQEQSPRAIDEVVQVTQERECAEEKQHLFKVKDLPLQLQAVPPGALCLGGSGAASLSVQGPGAAASQLRAVAHSLILDLAALLLHPKGNSTSDSRMRGGKETCGCLLFPLVSFLVPRAP